jgi:hypothetical protein
MEPLILGLPKSRTSIIWISGFLDFISTFRLFGVLKKLSLSFLIPNVSRGYLIPFDKYVSFAEVANTF